MNLLSSKINSVTGIKSFFSKKDFSERRRLFFNKYKVQNIKLSESDLIVAIDIIIPVIEKDLDILPHVVSYARKNIKHRINKIIIVAPESEKIIKVCKKLNLVFINENTVLSIQKSDISYACNGVDRSGWLFQQFIKLYADTISSSKYILVLDADTIFIKPIQFIIGNKKRIDFSAEYHLPYFDTYEKLTWFKHSYPVSFICHNMLFEPYKLRSLRLRVEKINKCTFIDAILNFIDSKELSFFSEYETYANFVLKKYKREYFYEYWHNVSLSKNKLDNLFEYINSINDMNIKSISFHSYNT
jgi:hypothetical protein